MAEILMVADAKTIPLADESVQCVVTSPPYWGLRDYGVEGQLGLEKTPEEYVAKMVEVFREVRRVLRKDGTLWLNLGDVYAHGKPGGGSVFDNGRTDGRKSYEADKVRGREKLSTLAAGLKPKDLCGIPWRVAFALQADGWWLRQDIIWSKPNPMPEGVTDRCTKAHEYLFLLTKSASYFYDAEAVKEAGSPFSHGGNFRGPGEKWKLVGNHSGQSLGQPPESGTRNRRSVWHIATQPYKGAHFATFPEKLVEPCVLAGTSEQGACSQCGAPWGRVVSPASGGATGAGWHDHSADGEKGNAKAKGAEWWKTYRAGETLGWKPTCTCAAPTKPCLVLDPFCGSGTVGVVCARFNRDFVGLDISEAYLELARQRIGDIPNALPFHAEVTA